MSLLETLKFRGMAENLDSQIVLAEKGAAVQEVSRNLLQEELRFRQERSIENRLRGARMTWNWTINSFPFAEQPDVNRSRIMDLAGLNFLQRGENIIFHGKTSTSINLGAALSEKGKKFYSLILTPSFTPGSFEPEFAWVT